MRVAKTDVGAAATLAATRAEELPGDVIGSTAGSRSSAGARAFCSSGASGAQSGGGDESFVVGESNAFGESAGGDAAAAVGPVVAEVPADTSGLAGGKINVIGRSVRISPRGMWLLSVR